nr:acid sphingomyelinase-like phosphodiesterase 3b [Onthophagus taurus]
MTGYFWHVTDFHFDPHFAQHGDVRKGCWKPNGSREPHSRSVGKYGDYSCDAPWDLIESATRAMASRQGDNVEFVLWTGDSLSLKRQIPETKQLHLLHNLTDLMLQTFNSQFVFPALGHDDPSSREELGKMWSRWLPPDTIETLETGGYYMIEKTDFKRHIIVLNTNLMVKDEDDVEAIKQWDWLKDKLQKVYERKETVYIVGHMPPGLDERQRGASHHEHLAFTDHNNRKYLKLIRKYSSIIQAQFFGHLHSDSFRVIYNEKGHPVSWIMLSPAVTPRRTTDGANNPGLRLYKFKKDTGQILDYTQYYLDLSQANEDQKIEPEWLIEYNFSSYYGISNITPLSLHTLAERLTSQSGIYDSTFKNYYRANSVKMHKDHHNCDANCAHIHFCTITRVDYEEHENCMKLAPSALASASGSQQNAPKMLLIDLFTFFVGLIIFV